MPSLYYHYSEIQSTLTGDATMGFLIVIVLVILIFASLPHWPYTRDRGLGYYPGSLLGLLLVILLILLFLRIIPWGWPGAYPY